jgi:DNA-binding winged helix-turn-helix (wHTH) protein
MTPEQTARSSANREDVPPSGPELRLMRNGALVKAYPLTSRGLTIGKAASNDVVVEGEYVSRVHARILGQPGRWLLEDANSTNGTFLYQEDQLIYSSAIDAEPCLLQDRQEIRLGIQPNDWRLYFSDPTTTAKAPPVYIDTKQRSVWIRGRQIKLPRDHYTVLLHLYTEAPQPCSYDALCAAVEEDRRAREKLSSEVTLESLHQLIHRLRARIEVDPRHPALVLQVPQFGYRLRNYG